MSAAAARGDRFAIEKIAAYLEKECGLVFAESKLYLFEQRLRVLLREHKIESLAALADRLGVNSALARQVIHCMTTHETCFFRDQRQFAVLRSTILDVVASRSVERPKRGIVGNEVIWSAGCSTGQEAYSLAILASQAIERARSSALRPGDLRVLASDVSGEVIARAREGRYSIAEAKRGLSPELQELYFFQDKGELGVVPRIRRLARFLTINLCRPFAAIGRFELILCRNVLIYFRREVARKIIGRMAKTQEKGAYLMLGASERLDPPHEMYDEVLLDGCTFYRRNGA